MRSVQSRGGRRIHPDLFRRGGDRRYSPVATDGMISNGEELPIAALIDRTIDVSVPEVFGSYLFLDSDPAAEIARSVERAVFLEAFGNTPELLAAEYGPYESSSLFLCIVDHRARRPAGAMRLILPRISGPGLKSVNDVEKAWGEPPSRMFERL